LYASIHRSTTAAFSSPDIASLLSRSRLLPLVACPTGTASSGNGPRISTRYLATTAIRIAMSGGADGGDDLDGEAYKYVIAGQDNIRDCWPGQYTWMREDDVRRETVDQAFHRLTAEARRQGITVYRVEGSKGPAWFSASQSRPGVAHALTAVSCDCDGFLRWQRCRHLAALLDRLEWLPVISPDPAPVALAVPSAPCPACDGAGVRRMSTGGGLDAWVYVDCRCRRAAA